MTPIVLAGLWDLARRPEQIRWQPFRPGVERHWIQRSENGGVASALLRYFPGARLARHRHVGVEHILVLTGAQEDERGRYEAGTLLVSPPGSSHALLSPGGCIVLAIWEKPVVFED